jgi:copper chaperone CopZ
MRNLIICLLFFTLVLSASSYATNFVMHESPCHPPKGKVVSIQTSAVCGMCETTLSQGLLKTKGVKQVKMDMATKVLSVTYNPKFINEAGIRKAVSMLGYDADDVPANPASYEKLHSCCKKDAVH